MQTEGIEQKIRKIQDLFLDQVEIRVGTDTEIEEGFPPHKIWWCKLVYVDDAYQEYDLYFEANKQTLMFDNTSASQISFATETIFEDAIDGLYNECIFYIKHKYYVHTDACKIIAIASSAVLQ